MQALLLAALLAVQPAGAAVVDDSHPTWSPDGKNIAFVRTTRRGLTVFVVRPDGRGLRRLPVSSGWDYPAWSPDGKTLAIVHPLRRNRTSIVLVRADGRGVRRLALGGAPAWSPKGRRIAFASGSGLAVVDVRSRRVRSLAEGGAGHPSWSPDGTLLAFSRGSGVEVVSARGGRVLTLGAGHAPVWSPDGGLIAAACTPGSYVAFLSPVAPGGGCNGGPHVFSTGRPDWSPDSTQIVTSGCVNVADCQIWVQPRGTFDKRVLGFGVDPRWSPNGRTIVFARGSDLYLMAADGSRVRPLFP